MVVVVINESLDSKEQARTVFLQLDVNVLVFYRFPKFFYPDVVFCAAVHTRLHLRIFSTGVSPFLSEFFNFVYLKLLFFHFRLSRAPFPRCGPDVDHTQECALPPKTLEGKTPQHYARDVIHTNFPAFFRVLCYKQSYR